jgi:hypothetical protein
MVRYADDAVLVFEHKSDADRVYRVLGKRFAKFGLTLHPEKTRLVYFERPSLFAKRQGRWCAKKPGTFDLLGFTHYWAQTNKGHWVILRKTAATRFRQSCRAAHEWLRRHRHSRIRWQHRALVHKLRGYIGYYGIPGNSRALRKFLHRVRCSWRFWLNRRSHKAKMTWQKMMLLLARYPLPRARIGCSV